MSRSQTSSSGPVRSPAELETRSAAERLSAQIEDALAAVAGHSNDSTEELEACADRLERAARDLAAALRELASRRAGAAEE